MPAAPDPTPTATMSAVRWIPVAGDARVGGLNDGNGTETVSSAPASDGQQPLRYCRRGGRNEGQQRGRNLSPYGKVLGLSLIHISEPTRLLSISYAVFCL